MKIMIKHPLIRFSAPHTKDRMVEIDQEASCGWSGGNDKIFPVCALTKATLLGGCTGRNEKNVP